MSRYLKFLTALFSGNSDQNIRFADICSLLVKAGFAERIKGSHHIFTRKGVPEIINLQPTSDGKTKPYQVKQVRELLIRYQLAAGPAAASPPPNPPKPFPNEN
jgi:predicted RNA binding protein YcfA (HicA-like mRNA interferase family)